MNVEKIQRKIGQCIAAIRMDSRTGPALRHFHQLLLESGVLSSMGPKACRPGCAECCWKIPIIRSHIEERYVEKGIKEQYGAIVKHKDRVEEAGREWRRLSREFGLKEDGNDGTMSFEKAWDDLNIRCPMLTKDRLCLLYGRLPIECRLKTSPSATCRQPGEPGHVFLLPFMENLAESVRTMEVLDELGMQREEVPVLFGLQKELVDLCKKVDKWMKVEEPWTDIPLTKVAERILRPSTSQAGMTFIG
jgi:hypothetical protein